MCTSVVDCYVFMMSQVILIKSRTRNLKLHTTNITIYINNHIAGPTDICTETRVSSQIGMDACRLASSSSRVGMSHTCTLTAQRCMLWLQRWGSVSCSAGNKCGYTL